MENLELTEEEVEVLAEMCRKFQEYVENNKYNYEKVWNKKLTSESFVKNYFISLGKGEN